MLSLREDIRNVQIDNVKSFHMQQATPLATLTLFVDYSNSSCMTSSIILTAAHILPLSFLSFSADLIFYYTDWRPRCQSIT